MEDKQSIFRQKSLDRVNSPEQLSSYLKVTSPSVWFILIAIIILLLGVIVWGTIGRLETTIATGAYVQDGKVYCYVQESDQGKVKEGHIIRINEKEYPVEAFGFAGQIKDSSDKYVVHLIGLNEGDFIYAAVSTCKDLSEGPYKATLVLDSVSPLSFVFN